MIDMNVHLEYARIADVLYNHNRDVVLGEMRLEKNGIDYTR